MALDGISKKPARTESTPDFDAENHPATERSTLSEKPYSGRRTRDTFQVVATDSATRRPVESESIPERGLAVDGDDVRGKRRAPRFVLSSSTALFLLDASFVFAAQAIILGFTHNRLALIDVQQGVLVLAISVLTNLIFLYAAGCYRNDTLVSSTLATSRLPVALALGGFVFFFALNFGMAALFPQSAVFLSISQCAMIVLIGASVSLCATMASRLVFYTLVRRGWFRRRILVLGTGKRALYLHKLMSQAPPGLVNQLLFVGESKPGDASASGAQEPFNSIPVSLRFEAIDVIARKLRMDEVVIAVDERRGLSLEGLLSCKTSGIPVTDYNTFIERETGRVDLCWLELSWLVYSNGFQMRPFDLGVKRFLDIAVSLAMLVFSLPVLLCACAAIGLERTGGIVFKQTRVTQDGRVFCLYKLRTMRPDAEVLGPQWAAENDPRITRVGAFLRRTRIDEIPQLFNVLRGDMSLVGPRPERPVFVEKLAQEIRMYNLRHSVKAGLTGWAQINFSYGASAADAERKLEYDLYYIKNYSLLRDFAILLQTLRVLIWPPGVR
jgi:sugar transferase (PEP-CTERM system associated)